MKEIRYTLVCDGPTDKALIPILTWLLHQHLPKHAVKSRWLDVRDLNRKPLSLSEKIRAGVELYPCDVLFIHRDAERGTILHREQEIIASLQEMPEYTTKLTVFVIPVRMTEAWLLFNESAIREAAENPHGKQPFENADYRNPEDIPDPKEELKKRLRSACGLSGRRLEKFNEKRAAARVADLIEDFSPLRNLSAFQKLEKELLVQVVRFNNISNLEAK